jgi:LacI family sucrose operon transcriptional repressor
MCYSKEKQEKDWRAMRKIKLEDVAAAAGVSPTTVSRVLNNRGYISDLTREKVENAVDEVGYIPNEVARSLSASKTNIVGIIFPNTTEPFYGEIVMRLENLLSQEGYKVLLCNTDDKPEKEKEHLKMLLSSQVDGLIVGSRNSPSEIYNKTNLAAVSIDRFISDTTPNIRSDNYQGAVLAAEYLLRKQCKQMALFVGSPPNEIARGDLRMKGFLGTLAKKDMQAVICPVSFDKGEHIQRQLISQHLEERPDIDGIFATGDTLAAIINGIALQKSRNIEIVGYDGTGTFLNLCPNISTIAQPIEEMAKTAVDILTKIIDGKYRKIEKEYVLPVKFVEKSI